MHAVFLGKQRYSERHGVAAFLAGAIERGHTAELLDVDGLLRTDLTDVDVVVAKSHYKIPAVRTRLAESGVRVVNSLAATDVCSSRFGLAKCLEESGVPAPSFLKTEDDWGALKLPWIAKPNRGGDHTLRTLTVRPSSIDLESTFYQSWLPTDEVMKVYSIGPRHELVRLAYESETTITEPVRHVVGPAPESVIEVVDMVATTTGLDVFNTDVIDHHGDLLVIDINPFPRLESVPNSHEHLWDLLEAG